MAGRHRLCMTARARTKAVLGPTNTGKTYLAIERMLAHPNIKIMLQTDYRDVRDIVPYRRVIFTGPVDEFFDYVMVNVEDAALRANRLGLLALTQPRPFRLAKVSRNARACECNSMTNSL